jgi:hypothetical protein
MGAVKSKNRRADGRHRNLVKDEHSGHVSFLNEISTAGGGGKEQGRQERIEYWGYYIADGLKKHAVFGICKYRYNS